MASLIDVSALHYRHVGLYSRETAIRTGYLFSYFDTRMMIKTRILLCFMLTSLFVSRIQVFAPSWYHAGAPCGRHTLAVWRTAP